MLTGSDITEAHWDSFFEFYMDTGSRKWGSPYLTRDFFSRIGGSMAEQILLVMARRGGRYIAGRGFLNLFGVGGILYGRNWGCTEYVPFLHFETCYYQAIEFAIARGLDKVVARPGGTEIAARLSARADLRRPLHRPSAGSRRAVDDFLSTNAPPWRRSGLRNWLEHGPFKKSSS